MSGKMRDIGQNRPDQGEAVKALNLNPPYRYFLPEGAAPTKKLLDYVPRISLDERDRRWREVRKRMLIGKVDVLLMLGNDSYWDMGFANIRYLTNAAMKTATHALFFQNEDPIMWNGPSHMVLPFAPPLGVSEWMSDFRPLMGLPEIAAVLKDKGYGRARVGVVGYGSLLVPGTIPEVDLQVFRNSMPDATFVDFTWIFEELRLLKTPEEIELQAQAGRIARKVIDTMVSSAKPGRTEAELYADMLHTQIVNGAEVNPFNLFATGPVEHDAMELWGLLHGPPQPCTPTLRPLTEGDLAISEFHTKYGGYIVHSEYTTYIGKKPPQKLADLFSIAVELLDLSRDVMRAGTTFREAWTKIRAHADRAKIDFVELGFHAKGLGSPEFPGSVYREGIGSITNNGWLIRDMVFEENMTMGINIDIFDPAWKVDVGVMYGDFVVIGKDAARSLIDPPREIGCSLA